MSISHIALCDLSKITEEQFFLREFNLSLNYESKDQEFDDSSNVIVSDNPKNWTRFLSSAPENSILFILIGNETYEPWKYEIFNDIKSISRALIYNPPRPCAYLTILKSLIGNLLDGGLISTGRPGSVFRDFRTSQYTKRKLANIQMRYQYLELPQGYCNSFVTQLSLLSEPLANLLSRNQSLYSEEFQIELASHIKKIKDFSYLGQLGHHRRATCLRVAARGHGVEIPSKVGFGGLEYDGDSTYLNNLLQTKFPLVPPGAFNNYNHRYSESLLTGGLPAILAQNSLDPSSNKNWTRNLPFPAGHSFRFLMRELSKITESEFKELQNKAFKEDLARVVNAKDFLNSMLS